MTPYEIMAISLSAIAILIPILQWAWRKWIQKPILDYHPNGKARLFFNQSGSYLRIDGVYEAKNKPISIKKIDVCIKRQKDSKSLNLTWSTFISPVVQRVGINAIQSNETAHPFRIEANSIMCAFIEFADAFDSYTKTFLAKTSTLFQCIPQIHTEEQDYETALKIYKSNPEFAVAHSLVEKEFFWEIGKYDVTIQTHYEKKTLSCTFEFSIGQADYQLISQNITESLLSPLEDSYSLLRNYRWVDVELK